MNNKEKIELFKDDYNENRTITFRELYEAIQNEMNTYDKLGKLDDLMNQKMSMQIIDLEGQVLDSYMTDFIGYLEDGTVMVVGNLRNIYFKKDKPNNSKNKEGVDNV